MTTPPPVSRLRLSTEALRPVAVTAMTDASLKLPHWDVGQRFQARVVADLPEGGFKVVIHGHPVALSLPYSAKPGEMLELVLVATAPRLTFLLEREGAGSGPIPHLSTTGRFIDTLLQHPPRTSPATQPPLLARPPGDGGNLAGKLHEVLAHSGLFYEAHLAQWAAGERPLAQLLREPQGRLAAALANPPPHEAREEPVLPDAGATLAPFDEALADAAEKPNLPAHPDTLPLLRQQLETLETRQLAWHGQIWPGQWLEWEIDERPPAERGDGDPPQWQTRLHLTLPRLGEVSAALTLGASGVRIVLTAQDAAAAAILQGGLPPLQQMLQGAGVPLLGMAVQHAG